MTQGVAAERLADYRVEGAYTQIDRLVALRRYANDLRLEGRHGGASQQAGEWKTRVRGRGIDFEEVRLYQPGDDIRSIDWRVTARSGKTHTKLYREERERPVMLAADQRSPMFFGSRCCFKSVLAATLLSCLGWAALANRDRVGGVIFGDRSHRDIRPRRSKHAMLEWIRQLDTYNHRLQTPCPEDGGQPLALLLERLVHICRPGSALLIASDFHDLDDACAKRLHQLARHTDLTLFCLSDPLEQGVPDAGRLWISNGRRRQRLEGGGADSPLARTLSERHQRLHRLCGPLGISLLHLSTDTALMPLLQQRYGRRGRGR